MEARRSVRLGKRISKALVVGVYLLAVVFSFTLSYFDAMRHHRELAASLGKAVFRTVLTSRNWNASLGGVYAQESDSIRPNPFLKDPKRDLITEDGTRLTKLNPAYMTRLISEYLVSEQSIKTHITSLMPINPGNAPDAWEREALTVFETRGEKVVWSVEDDGSGGRLFRYMEPLMVEQSCLKCHEEQGYKIGDVRGGIGVNFDYAPFIAQDKEELWHRLLIHLLMGGVGTLLLLLVMGRLQRMEEVSASLEREAVNLRSLLPMCAWCKKIRTESGDSENPETWVPVEEYLEDRQRLSTTHGICPECMAKWEKED